VSDVVELWKDAARRDARFADAQLRSWLLRMNHQSLRAGRQLQPVGSPPERIDAQTGDVRAG
jgi:hypothetical protein